MGATPGDPRDERHARAALQAVAARVRVHLVGLQLTVPEDFGQHVAFVGNAERPGGTRHRCAKRVADTSPITITS